MILSREIDLSHPLTDHPFLDKLALWLLPIPQLAGSGKCVKLYDLSAYQRHATQSDPTLQPTWAATERGIGLEFDGVNDAMSTAFAEVSNQWTAAIDFRTALIYSSSSRVLIGHTDYPSSDSTTNLVSYGANGWLQGYWWDGSLRYMRTAANVIRDNSHHIAVVACDCESQASRHIAVDGVQQGLATNSPEGVNIHNGIPLQIARRSQYVQTNYHNSMIHGAMWLQRLISKNEAAFFYEQSLIGYPDLLRYMPTRTWFLFGAPSGVSVPGVEYRARDTRPHYAAKENKLHYRARDRRVHYASKGTD